ncbi:hypothetical protein C8J31_11427 [Rhizobium sp. PP-CC-2G-626]|nr:hypothetical protein C8J31_11427 [Rhizobium sp. PP-CC-2G-626]
MKRWLGDWLSWRVFAVVLVVVVTAVLLERIISDSLSSSGFLSVSGKTELATVSLSVTESQYQWSLSGAYTCYGSENPPPDSQIAGDTAANALCKGPHGKSDRVFSPLPDDVSLAITADTTLEVAVAAAPRAVEATSYPGGKVPNAILIISKVTSLDSRCSPGTTGTPTMTAEGFRRPLWDEAEIHVPMTETTLMPFEGKIRLGQSISSNTTNQLREGTVAVFRKVNYLVDLWGFHLGRDEPDQVTETNLLPGDVVKFERSKDCYARTSGFMRAIQDDQGGFIQVVASMQAAEGRVMVERARPGPSAKQDIAITSQLADAVLNHPYTVWLGLFVSICLVLKELWEFAFARKE